MVSTMGLLGGEGGKLTVLKNVLIRFNALTRSKGRKVDGVSAEATSSSSGGISKILGSPFVEMETKTINADVDV